MKNERNNLSGGTGTRFYLLTMVTILSIWGVRESQCC